MENSSRFRTGSQIKQILEDQDEENNYFSIDILSPWNNHHLTTKNVFNSTLKSIPPLENNQNRPISKPHFPLKTQNLRIKTQASKPLRESSFHQFEQKIAFLNNFYSTQVVHDGRNTNNNSRCCSRKSPIRQKFRTPVININDISFHQIFTQPLIGVRPNFILRDKSVEKKGKISFYFPQKKESTNPCLKKTSNFNKLKRFSTQKNIPPSSSVEKRNLRLAICQGSRNKNRGILIDHLNKLIKTQNQDSATISIKTLKSKSLNKFNKTYY